MKQIKIYTKWQYCFRDLKVKSSLMIKTGKSRFLNIFTKIEHIPDVTDSAIENFEIHYTKKRHNNQKHASQFHY